MRRQAVVRLKSFLAQIKLIGPDSRGINVRFVVFWLQEQKCCESALLARGARLTNRPLRLAAIRHAATESRLHPRGIHSTHAGPESLPGRGAKHGNGLPQGEGEILLCRLHSKGKKQTAALFFYSLKFQTLCYFCCSWKSTLGQSGYWPRRCRG